MELIVNEEIVGRRLDKDGITSNQNPLHYGKILIKYYKHIGLTNQEIIDKLNEKVKIKNDSDGLITNAIITSLTSTINIHGKFRDGIIEYSENELSFIRDLNDINLEKFLFTFLSLSKVYNNNVKIIKNAFMRMALLKDTSKEFDKYFDILYQNGLVTCKEGSYMVRNVKNRQLFYCLVKENFPEFQNKNIKLKVYNTNNPVLYYLSMYGYENVEVCDTCKEPYLKSNKSHSKYNLCKYCKNKMRKEQSKNIMRERRRNVSNQEVDWIP